MEVQRAYSSGRFVGSLNGDSSVANHDFRKRDGLRLLLVGQPPGLDAGPDVLDVPPAVLRSMETHLRPVHFDRPYACRTTEDQRRNSGVHNLDPLGGQRRAAIQGHRHGDVSNRRPSAPSERDRIGRHVHPDRVAGLGQDQIAQPSALENDMDDDGRREDQHDQDHQDSDRPSQHKAYQSEQEPPRRLRMAKDLGGSANVIPHDDPPAGCCPACEGRNRGSTSRRDKPGRSTARNWRQLPPYWPSRRRKRHLRSSPGGPP